MKNLRSPAALRARLDELGCALPVDDDPRSGAGAPLAEPLSTPAGVAPNRFSILPMEGWDAAGDGRPTDLVRRRWARFGSSGAGLVWGGEAVAVRADGRANPNQLLLDESTVEDIAALRVHLLEAAAAAGQPAPVVGLQLTHSGRFARPDGIPAPRTAYPHPVLDRRVGATEQSVLRDDELEDLIEAYVAAGHLAAQAGYAFVDIKSCHGYLLHELLSGVDRPGPFGGDLGCRAGVLLAVLRRLRAEVPGLALGVRLSLFDLVPWHAGADGVGEPEPDAPLPSTSTFGGDGTLAGIDLTATHQLVELLEEAGVGMLCTTAGSPYYTPHIQRPAYFPPSDGYQPPEDPLIGVTRLLEATRAVTEHHPDLVVVASGLSYLQDWVAHVGQPLIAEGWAHSIGLGRMALSYPDMPADVLAGRPLQRRLVCRTFSDCTTAPRNGLVSGCYPLDQFYKERPERVALAKVKRAARGALPGAGAGADP